jgi:hypothetical protein
MRRPSSPAGLASPSSACLPFPPQYYEGPHGKWDSVNKLIDSIKEYLGVAEPAEAEDAGFISQPESDESDQDMLVDANDIATTLSRFQQEAALLGSWVECSRLLGQCTDDWRQWGRVLLIMQVRGARRGAAHTPAPAVAPGPCRAAASPCPC